MPERIIVPEKYPQCPYCYSSCCNWREELKFARKNCWNNDVLLFCMDFRRFQLEKLLGAFYAEFKKLNKSVPDDKDRQYRRDLSMKIRVFKSLLAGYEYDIHREVTYPNISGLKVPPKLVVW